MNDEPTERRDEPIPDAAPLPAEAEEGGRDPLRNRAERIAELPLAERSAAFDGLNRAVVAELQSLEEV